MIAQCPLPPPKRSLGQYQKKTPENRNQTVPAVHYPTQKLEPVSDIPPAIAPQPWPAIPLEMWRHPKPNPQLLWKNHFQQGDRNQRCKWVRPVEQGPPSGRCSQQGHIGRHHANPVKSKKRKWTSQENKIAVGCYLSAEPKIRGHRKRIRVYDCKNVCFGYQNKD